MMHSVNYVNWAHHHSNLSLLVFTTQFFNRSKRLVYAPHYPITRY